MKATAWNRDFIWFADDVAMVVNNAELLEETTIPALETINRNGWTRPAEKMGALRNELTAIRKCIWTGRKFQSIDLYGIYIPETGHETVLP